MLLLLTSPAWVAPQQSPCRLPVTVPSALLVVLATQANWMSREQLALIFWPDARPADALRNLRLNLHRARILLESWGQHESLEVDRNRLHLKLPSDLAQLRTEQTNADLTTLHRLSPTQWLQGWQLPGFNGFAQWCDDTVQNLQSDWLRATRLALTRPPANNKSEQRAVAPPGREDQLKRMLASTFPALLLLGEPGAGKTTLLRTAFPSVLCIRGLEGLHAMAYRPLLDCLRQNIPRLMQLLAQTSHPLRPYRLDLARVVPELALDEPLPPLDAQTARTRLVEALARAFESLTPLLLVDDLQWCDSATIEWLLMLAHNNRLVWRAAARRHEIGASLAQSLESINSVNRLETIEVTPLSRQAVAQVCREQWPEQSFDESELDRLHELCGGNAFLLCEIMAAEVTGETNEALLLTKDKVQHTVFRLVQARAQALPLTARLALEAAAVFVQPVPQQALRCLALCTQSSDDADWFKAIDHAKAIGLIEQIDEALFVCRHDLIRQAVMSSLSVSYRNQLHRQAALWLAQQTQTQADDNAITIAEHWRAAGENQTALTWLHRGAEQLKARGRFDDARKLWQQVADESVDAAQALRAQLDLAACDLFEDLRRGQAALQAVRAQLPAVADPEQHCQIEGRVLAAMIDNRVFAGDLITASKHATRLQELLASLTVDEQINAIEVLIELAMRQPDIAQAWSLHSRLAKMAPNRPTLLSYKGQIHWFGGQCQAAHDSLAKLLARHPDYCRGITVENDLAVMLQALGRVAEAEIMAKRSLESWAGVAHTETLSLLVLGLALTSAGRLTEADADAALLQALEKGRAQGSVGFEAEALVRRALLLLEWGKAANAQASLDLAAPLLTNCSEPLRLSQWLLAQARAAHANSKPLPTDALPKLRATASTSEHPLVHVRLAQVEHLLACEVGDLQLAVQSANSMVEIARTAGLLEPLSQGLLLHAKSLVSSKPELARSLAQEALLLSQKQGFANLEHRIKDWLKR
jgi:tetratricopeptide (TPR) repeat protein